MHKEESVHEPFREELTDRLSKQLADALTYEILLYRQFLIDSGHYLDTVDTALEIIFQTNSSLLTIENFKALARLSVPQYNRFETALIEMSNITQDKFDALVSPPVRVPALNISRLHHDSLEELSAPAVQSFLEPITESAVIGMHLGEHDNSDALFSTPTKAPIFNLSRLSYDSLEELTATVVESLAALEVFRSRYAATRARVSMISPNSVEGFDLLDDSSVGRESRSKL